MCTGSKPKQPDPPPPPAQQPQQVDATAAGAGDTAKRRARYRAGHKATVMTGSQGLGGDSATGKTILGG